MIGDLIIEIFKQQELQLYWEGKETNVKYPFYLMREDGHNDVKTMQRVVMNRCRIVIMCLAESSRELNEMSEKVKDILDYYKGVVTNRKIRSIRYMGMNPEVIGEDAMALDFEVNVEPK